MPHPYMFHIEGRRDNEPAIRAAVAVAFHLHGPIYRQGKPESGLIRSAGVIRYAPQENKVWFSGKGTKDATVSTLVMSGYDDQVSMQNSLIPWTEEEAANLIVRWLRDVVEYPKDEPDTDGSVKPGFCIFLPLWRSIQGVDNVVLAVQPAWCVYGK